MGFTCRGTLLVFAVMCTNITPGSAETIWKCSGKPTTYTFTDCETDKSLTDGCYYLVHFEQYRPCNDICDGVEMWSIDEERCRSYCPAYLSNFCTFHSSHSRSTPLKVQPTATTQEWHRTTVGRKMTTQIPKQNQQSILLVLTGALGGLLVTGILSTVIVCIQRKRSLHNPSNDIETMTLRATTDVSHLNSLKCKSPSEKLAYPVEASTDNKQNKVKEMCSAREDSALMVD